MINGNLIIKGNTIDIQELYSSTWKTNEPAELTGLISFHGPIHVDLFNPEGLINRVDVVSISQDAIYIDTHYRIMGRKILKKGAKITSVNAQIVNEVEFSSFLTNVVFIDEPAVLNGIFFQNHVKFLAPFNSMGHLTVGGLVGGHDLEAMFGNALYIDKDAVVSGHVTFLKDIQVFGNLQMEGKINGLDVSDDVVRLSGMQTIGGTKVFQDVFSASSAAVETSVNGYHLKTLREDTLMNYGNQVIAARCEIGVSIYDQIETSLPEDSPKHEIEALHLEAPLSAPSYISKYLKEVRVYIIYDF